MTPFALTFLALAAFALVVLPARWALLPLLLGACYMTAAQQMAIGPFHFTVLRTLIAIGVCRVLVRGEARLLQFARLDLIVVAWGVSFIAASVFHNDISDTLVNHLGIAYNSMGIYFLARILAPDEEGIVQLIKVLAIVLVPLALEMVNEKITGHNLFSYLGGVADAVPSRDGKLRAIGPFGHSILAGTVGGVCAPLMIGIWRYARRPAQIGLVACVLMIWASTSSGPIASLIAAVFALAMWRWRHLTGRMRMAAVVIYLLLELVMSRPAYFIIQRVDFTGSSTGWHRAELIRQAIGHFREWAIAGTDYTRHWMPYGVSANGDNSDITNHYLYYGVWGGFIPMFLFIAALWTAFRYIGQITVWNDGAPFAARFLVWSVGAAIFTHAVTCISAAYWDQSVVFLYITLAAAATLYCATREALALNAAALSAPCATTAA